MLDKLTQNIRGIIDEAIQKQPEARALIVFDAQSSLSKLLTEAYRAVLPSAQAIDFDSVEPQTIFDAIDALDPNDLVILVQSTSFRLDKFRFRLELFRRDLAVIEHPHLGRMPDNEVDTYIDALAYDKDYYRTVGPKLKGLIDNAERIVVACDGTELVYEGGFEDAKLNIGDYSGMQNTGGQFPIGEVFTEPVSFEKVNGTVKLYAFGNERSRTVVADEAFTVVIKEGKIVDAPDAPESFKTVLDKISADEPLWIRELGLGLNRALTRTRTLHDVGSYERMCGIHLSIGQKHTIYKKPGFPKRKSKYHVDVFADVSEVTIDGVVVYRDGEYVV